MVWQMVYDTTKKRAVKNCSFLLICYAIFECLSDYDLVATPFAFSALVDDRQASFERLHH